MKDKEKVIVCCANCHTGKTIPIFGGCLAVTLSRVLVDTFIVVTLICTKAGKTCNAMSAGIQLSLQVTRCQLKNQRLYKALPPPHQRKSARFISVTEQRKLTWRISKRHIYFMTIKTIYSRNKMNINVVLCLS